MIGLKIAEVKKYNNYVFLDNNGRKFYINIEFLGDKIPKINDYIYIDDKILKIKNLYTFGPLNSIYSKNINIDEEELIKVVTKKEEYYLQRYYG